MALHEETVIDHRYGRFINHNFAEYHVPVNADIHDIDVIFVEELESHLNPLGVKGVGEIGKCRLPRDRRAGARPSHYHRQASGTEAATLDRPR
jgi:hypothetical protein